MKPLTKDEKWLLDEKVAKGETIKLWMAWPVGHEHITRLTATPHELLFVNDDPEPLRSFKLGSIDYDIFTNYWHAYAYKLKLEDK